MKLSPHFSLSEFTKSQTSVRLNIDNTPSLTTIDNLQLLVDNVLQPTRIHFGRPVTVSSGYRSSKLNTAIGGSATSDHTKGQAADIEIVGVDNKVLAEFIRDNLPFTQLILEFYTDGIPDSGWVHVSYDKDDLKKEVLKASKNSANVTVYTRGF